MRQLDELLNIAHHYFWLVTFCSSHMLAPAHVRLLSSLSRNNFNNETDVPSTELRQFMEHFHSRFLLFKQVAISLHSPRAFRFSCLSFLVSLVSRVSRFSCLSFLVLFVSRSSCFSFLATRPVSRIFFLPSRYS